MHWRPSGRRRNAEVEGFLDQMAAGSRARAEAAAAAEPLAVLRARCEDLPPPLPPARAGGFDLIAELKLRSPALGELGDASDDLAGRVTGYAKAGAAAVSVLTEPSRFAGSLDHLRAAAAALAPLGVPAMRKDFLVDPYQLYEARAAGAGGALLIVRMLSRGMLGEMLDCARGLGLFVLVETFDEEDIAIAVESLGTGTGAGSDGPARSWQGAALYSGDLPARSESRQSLAGRSPSSSPRPHDRWHDASGAVEEGRVPERASFALRSEAEPSERAGPTDRRPRPGTDRRTTVQPPAPGATPRAGVLLGVNSRDLQTLAVVPERLEQLAPRLPREYPRVAESGLTTPEDAARMVRAGYDMALVGGALMSAQDPGALVAAMLSAGREAAA